jgi:hypothetical protein
LISGDKISWYKISKDKISDDKTIGNIISGDVKRINAYRENLKTILEGRKRFLDNLINDKHEFYSDEQSVILERIKFYQLRVEYFSEERNRPRVAAGEQAWNLFVEVNYQFLICLHADNPEKVKMRNMYVLKERLKILELQLIALEILRIEREES